ncbi:group III truncated hemoglobin [Beijerinckia indica]|uniref:Protozoan/cyanobacterial globin family protein n=1 Tax=Beijerinckia indica subsp. indica (strain ATCC 9039 / DSM 1715 / NCIMB 8712) TaxID=395963 RepID=B2IHF9_BEII9|nr:group III truncated hemoglobin [Beijerinckia indica]ACB95944.1 protozoan/cyanobacterial globin family protein [Beijerinckia indica subsp. indica ATCC 9039]
MDVDNKVAPAPELTDAELQKAEKAIADCVEDFYAKARKDDLLGPIFNATVHDWDVHLRVVANFWSHVILKTKRYSGSPYVVHHNLPLELEHFPRWLALFEESAQHYLSPEHAERALGKARHMAESFKAGIFPFVGKDGKPSRHPG